MSIKPPSRTFTHRFHRKTKFPPVDLAPIVVKVPEEYKAVQPYFYDDLVRLGNLADGGYVIPKSLSLQAKALISLGLALEWTFEHDFALFNPGAKVYGYDHTTRAALRGQLKEIYTSKIRWFGRTFLLRPLKWLKKRFDTQPSILDALERPLVKAPKATFMSQLIGPIKDTVYLTLDYFFFWQRVHKHVAKKVTEEKDKENVSLAKIFAELKANPVVLKIDIEGSEYETIDAILHYADRISALIIEFHEIDKVKQRFLSAIRKLNEKFAIVHIHGNNFSPLTRDGFPDVIELTFIPKDQLTSTEKRTAFPVAGLDYPNWYDRADYALQF